MILTDREWLRFVTFALVAGGALGALYTGALIVRGHSLMWTVAGGVIGTGLIAVLVHLAMRFVLDKATDPTEETA